MQTDLLFSIHRMFRNSEKIVYFFVKLTIVNVDERNALSFFHFTHAHMMEKGAVRLNIFLIFTFLKSYLGSRAKSEFVLIAFHFQKLFQTPEKVATESKATN